MFIRVFLALVVFAGLMVFIAWYSRANDQQRNQAIKNMLLYGLGIALLLLVVTGRIPWLFALVSAAIPFYRRALAFKGIINFFGKNIGPTKLTTKWLIVQYDFGKKTLDAKIIQGEFEGQHLSELADKQLQTLLEQCKTDIQSRAAVHAFMAMRHSSGSNEQHNPVASSQLSKQQAYEVLGLQDGASQETIKQAHKRLMQKLHPDRGGSTYLATQINAAKDTLLNS